MESPLIEFKDVYKKLGTTRVLKGANFSINKGEATTIIGKSGTGKSVLLKHIVGLLEPDSGQILFDGKPFGDMTKPEKEKWLDKISYMFQNMALFDSLTIYENIALPLKYGMSLPKQEIDKRVKEKLAQLDITGIENKYPEQLSGGMKKRVAMARALVTDPEIILFDEPTTGLDPIRKNAVHSMINEYREKYGFTIVLISHEIPDVFYITQKVVMLDKGKIIFEGTPGEIQSCENPVISEFIKGVESHQDDLTGLGTKIQGQRKFNEEMERLHNHEIIFSVLILTVENLREIIEKIGHFEGQEIIKNFATQVQNRIKTVDSCSRHGMDKLMVVLHNCNMDQARKFCINLAKGLKLKEIIPNSTKSGISLSISAGFAEAKKQMPFESVVADAQSSESTYFEFSVK